MTRKFFAPTLAAEGAGGGSPPPAAAAPPAPPPASLETLAPAGAPPPAVVPVIGTPYRPKGLPDTLLGKSDRETLDNLVKDYGARPQPPPAAKDYKLELAPELAKKLGDLDKDPVLPLWRDVAHKNGLSQQQFQASFIDLIGALDKAGLLADPIDGAKEYQGLVDEAGKTARDPAAAKQAVATRMAGAKASLADLAARQVLSKAEAGIAEALLATGDGVRFLEKAMTAMGGQPKGLDAGGNAPGDTRTPLEKSLAVMFPTMAGAAR